MNKFDEMLGATRDFLKESDTHNTAVLGMVAKGCYNSGYYKTLARMLRVKELLDVMPIGVPMTATEIQTALDNESSVQFIVGNLRHCRAADIVERREIKGEPYEVVLENSQKITVVPKKAVFVRVM